eukprot:53930-Amphidinium_carterae.2
MLACSWRGRERVCYGHACCLSGLLGAHVVICAAQPVLGTDCTRQPVARASCSACEAVRSELAELKNALAQLCLRVIVPEHLQACALARMLYCAHVLHTPDRGGFLGGTRPMGCLLIVRWKGVLRFRKADPRLL